MVRVAAIQMDGRLGDLDWNLGQVRELLSEATARGARAIALPEFFTTPIALDQSESVRHCALAPDNKAVDLLSEFATTHDAVIGGSYLERRDNGDVYNCYAVVRPDGTVTRHDKDLPTMIENAFYVGGDTDGVHETDLGAVGTAMCWETIRTQTVRRLSDRVDFLMTGSHWWTVPLNWKGPAAFYDKSDRENRTSLFEAPSMMSSLLGVAVLHGSHCGELRGRFPVLPRRLFDVDYDTTLIGETQIVDNAGNTVARMTEEDGPGVIDAEIDLVRGTPSASLPDRFWIPKLTLLARLFWWQQNFMASGVYKKAKAAHAV